MRRDTHLGPEWLRLRLLSGDSLAIARSEILPTIRHRLSLFYFAAVICLLIVMDIDGSDGSRPFWQDAIFYVALKLGLISSIAAILMLLRLRARTTGHLPVHLSALTVAIAAGVVAASQIASWHRGEGILESPALVLALFILCWVITEVEVLAYMTWVVPHILRDLRARTTEALPPPAGGGTAAPPIMIGDLAIDPATVRHVRAEGNYVDIRTDTDRHYVLATFSTVIAALDRQDGRQIHRSHWIAARAMHGFYRDGRDIIVRLADGTEVAVAQSRQKDLLPWLQAVTVRL